MPDISVYITYGADGRHCQFLRHWQQYSINFAYSLPFDTFSALDPLKRQLESQLALIWIAFSFMFFQRSGCFSGAELERAASNQSCHKSQI